MQKLLRTVKERLKVLFRPLSFFVIRGQDLNVEKLYRYSKKDRTIFVDLRLERHREIYNEWEFAPDSWGDLDDDLFRYLKECVREIPAKYRLCIVFHLPAAAENAEKEKASINGYHDYINYRIRKLRVEIRKERKKLLMYLVSGAVMLACAFFLGDSIVNPTIRRFVSEGFFVGAWVILWELFSALFFTSVRLTERFGVLKRLNRARIEYVYDVTGTNRQ